MLARLRSWLLIVTKAPEPVERRPVGASLTYYGANERAEDPERVWPGGTHRGTGLPMDDDLL